MSDEPDPEVVADLQLRAFTERDRTRSRTAPTYVPPVIAATWPCRNPACRKPVAITVEAVEQLARFNAPMWDSARENRPLKESAIAVCDDCALLAKNHRSEQAEKRRYDLSKAIKLLRESKSPRDEAELLGTIRKLNHPDVQGLIEAIESRQKLPGSKRAKREDI